MGFRCGIIGLPNVGKSTIFNALTAAGAEVANYPFCTIDPNVGVVPVPDDRLDAIADIIKPPKYTHTSMEFVDIAGLVKGASRGEGLGNKFLGHIRDLDAVIHVVRCFDDVNVSHVSGKIDPSNDIDVVNMELILADLETIERRRSKAERLLKTGEKKVQREIDMYRTIEEALEKGMPARTVPVDDLLRDVRRDINLITDKKVLYLANVSETVFREDGEYIRIVSEIAGREGSGIVVICGDMEAEIALLPQEERKDFMDDLGLKESGFLKLIRAGYELLDLITFYTAAGAELRAWTIKRGTRAAGAAGKIHTDMERGFIRAEILHYEDFVGAGTIVHAKELGLMKIEGRDYVVEDGDIVYFRFNV